MVKFLILKILWEPPENIDFMKTNRRKINWWSQMNCLFTLVLICGVTVWKRIQIDRKRGIYEKKKKC